MPQKPRRFRIRISKPKTKKQWIIAIAAAVLSLGIISGAVYWFVIKDNSLPSTASVDNEPEPTPPEPIYSIISGREITDASLNTRPGFAVQIENSPDARPQSGLIDADIVTEAVAEGGITRFNAIFHDKIPANIGPVRSLRPYYIDWFLPYDVPIVHAGGSPEALSDVRRLGVKSMDSVSTIMRRISSRYSPHNYYTTGKQVLDLAVERGYKLKVDSPLPRVKPSDADQPAEEGTEAKTPPATPATVINVRISSALYNVKYTWSPSKGVYLREQGGNAHKDADSGSQIAPNVVIVPIMSKGIHRDGVHTSYGTTGSGKVYIFQKGTVIQGTWAKSSRSAQWQLKDNRGEIIPLEPGQTWFTITDASGNVKYAP